MPKREQRSNASLHVILLLLSSWLLPLGAVQAQHGNAGPQQNGGQMHGYEAAFSEAAHRSQLTFEKNIGQHSGEVAFVTHEAQATHFLTRQGFRTSITDSDGERRAAYGMRFLGMSDQATFRSHPIRGPNRNRRLNVLNGDRQHNNIPQFQKVSYQNVWDGIAVHYYSHEEGLKYDFAVEPGADYHQIRFEMEGVSDLQVTAEGELSFQTDLGVLQQGLPYSYQIIDGQEVEISSAYRVEGYQVVFEIGAYNTDYPLIIDPVALKWSTVLGGSYDFEIIDAHYDQENNLLYLAGQEESSVYPTDFTVGNAGGNPSQAFVACMRGDGSEMLWKTQIRSISNSRASGIELDEAGNIYVITSQDFANPNPYSGVNPEVEGVLMTLNETNNNNKGHRALFKFANDGHTLKYFTYLTDPAGVPSDGSIIRPYSYAEDDLIIDHNGQVVLHVLYRDNHNNDQLHWPENTFSAFPDNVFGQTLTKGRWYSNLMTIDTEVPGRQGLVNSAVIDFWISGLERDAAGNIYMIGTNAIYARDLNEPTYANYNEPWFTHQPFAVDDLDAGESLPLALIKLAPDQDEVLFASFIGYGPDPQAAIEPRDIYLEPSYSEDLTVTPEGDVYIGANWYFYPYNPYPTGGWPVVHQAEKQTILEPMYDIYECDGFCGTAQTITKYPAGQYDQPEWMVQVPSNGDYIPPRIAVDQARDKVHFYGVIQDVGRENIGANASFLTPGAFGNKAGYDDRIYWSYGMYLQLNQAGDLIYGTSLSTEDVNYEYPSGLELDTATGTAILIRDVGSPEPNFPNNTFLTPSYRDFTTNEQVDVFGGDVIPVNNGKSTFLITAFHDAQPGANLIDTFRVGLDTFCTGGLIGLGEEREALKGNTPGYISGDGSDPSHNLPDLYVEGIRQPHPPVLGQPQYQWEYQFKAEGLDTFSAWVPVDGGTQRFLVPQTATEPGQIRYRRVATVGEYTLLSNEIEAVVTGAPIALSIAGPEAPVYFCRSASTDLGISVTNGSANISWQWYRGGNPVDNALITPASGSDVAAGSFSAAVAAGNTQPGSYRLLVTDESSGCKKEFFVTLLSLDAPALYPSDSVRLCPGAEEITLGPDRVNPALDYRYTYPDNSQSNITRPTVTVAGTYTLEVAVEGSDEYCTIGADTLEVEPLLSAFDTALVAPANMGFCSDDSPVAIGISGAPAGYDYQWSPVTGLSNPAIANPEFNPAAAAAAEGIRQIDYLFRATRTIDGCVFEANVTVSDTTLAVADPPFYDEVFDGSDAGIITVFPGDDFKGSDLQWRVVDTDFPGGLPALEASADFGLGAKGQITSSTAQTPLYYPAGEYYMDLELQATFGTIGVSGCADANVTRVNIGTPAGPSFSGIRSSFPGTLGGSCSGENSILCGRIGLDKH